MPRNKSAKRTAKRQPANKRQSANNTLATILKMEKDLLAFPAKLAIQLNKEINASKQKESKAAKALNKIRMAAANADKRSKEAQAKDTPTAKKQFKKFKKAHTDAIKMFAKADKQHQEISLTLDSFLKKQAKLIAMDKHLSQFEKEWSKNSKKAQAKPNASKKIVRATPPKMEQPTQIENMEVLVDKTQFNEPTELAS